MARFILYYNGTVSNPLGSVASGDVAPNVGGTSVTITANTTFTFPAPVGGGVIYLEIIQGAGGSHTGTFAATSGSVLFSGGSKTLSTVAGTIDLITAWSDGTNWLCILTKAFA